MSLLSSFSSPVNALIIGASGGIGSAFVDLCVQDSAVNKVYAFSRKPVSKSHEKIMRGSIDICDQETIREAAQSIDEDIHLVIVASGILHDDVLSPEKTIRDLDIAAMQKVMQINMMGPAMAAKYFLSLLPRQGRSVFAAISARVGSISDNQVGGWYSYRASKAALNMMIKTAAIEVARKYKDAVMIGLHPGTVETDLSAPFRSNVRHDIFSPRQSAEYLLKVINQVTPAQSGKLLAWDGQEIQP